MITLNTFDLLKSIGSSGTVFGNVEAEFEKAALTIMKKLLKARDLTVVRLRDVCRAIGAEPLGVVIDHLADKEVAALVKKLDKLWPDAKTSAVADQREHVLALASGGIEPAVKSAVAAKLVKSSTPKAKKPADSAGWSKSMAARPPQK
jgi:hypothetical protein